MASYTLILLSLVFAPFYFRTRIPTLPEFLERRYSPASRSFLAFMAIVAAVFIHFGMSLQAWWMFCICSVIYVVVTLLTPAPAPESVHGLTWDHPLGAVTQERFKGLRDPRLIGTILAVTVAVLYYTFR